MNTMLKVTPEKLIEAAGDFQKKPDRRDDINCRQP